MSVFPQGTSGNGPGKFQTIKPTNKGPANDSGGDGTGEDLASYRVPGSHGESGDAKGLGSVKSNPVCDSLISELKTLWNRFMTINSDARSEAITLKGPSTKKKTFLGERVDKKSVLYRQCTTKLKSLKKERVVVVKEHRKTWQDLKKKKCSIETILDLSPKEMIEYRPFPKF
ncbi:hypothetical protein BASA60_002638 [Batrachochytrium salamandrivorans]|nr:hypothetical protein BASA62_000557 [Batrachochytrium salamandrivorans]KAH6581002.1 hypothetical protein BASA60_002638 [Batrachochytrium salamandrivorans]